MLKDEVEKCKCEGEPACSRNAMEKRSLSTSDLEAIARHAHRATLASAFAKLPWALGSWDLRMGLVGPCTSAYRKLRRDFNQLTFLKIIDETNTSNMIVGKGRNGGGAPQLEGYTHV